MIKDYVSPKKFEARGIDVSKWQGEVDWKAVKDDGIKFAMIRLGLGSKNGSGYRIDPFFEKNVSGATKAGLDVGCYFYSYADSCDEAWNEAQFVIKVLNDYKGVFTYPIVLDLESSILEDLSKNTLTEIVKTFGRAIRGAGYYFMLYSNPNWLTYHLHDEMLSDIDHWLAEWKEKPTYTGEYGIWQYGNGIVEGITGNADMDIAYRDYPTIIKSAGLNGFKWAETQVGMISGTKLLEKIRNNYCASCRRKCLGCETFRFISFINEMMLKKK